MNRMNGLQKILHMTDEQYERLMSIVKNEGTFVLVCLIDLLIFSLTGYGIPCIFHLVTRLYCPGCGITRACIAILHGDFREAFRLNALSLTLLPALMLYLLIRGYRYIKNGKTGFSIVEDIFLTFSFLICIFYAIVKNIDFMIWVSKV